MWAVRKFSLLSRGAAAAPSDPPGGQFKVDCPAWPKVRLVRAFEVVTSGLVGIPPAILWPKMPLGFAPPLCPCPLFYFAKLIMPPVVLSMKTRLPEIPPCCFGDSLLFLSNDPLPECLIPPTWLEPFWGLKLGKLGNPVIVPVPRTAPEFRLFNRLRPLPLLASGDVRSTLSPVCSGIYFKMGWLDCWPPILL